MSATCPRCKKRIPGGNSGGHCARCHESFRGDTAFDKHLIRHTRAGHTYALTCQNPAEAVSPTGKPLPYWQDKHGAWHYGKRGYWTAENLNGETND